jgi:hypothetical protein
VRRLMKTGEHPADGLDIDKLGGSSHCTIPLKYGAIAGLFSPCARERRMRLSHMSYCPADFIMKRLL